MIGLLPSGWAAPLGFIRVNDEIVDVIRRRVQAKVASLKIKGRSRRAAEQEIVQAARAETLACFAEASPASNHRLRPTWPLADCILCDDGLAVIDVWIGHDYADNGDGISPVRIMTSWRVRGSEKSKVEKG
jgi:hypothetical protein